MAVSAKDSKLPEHTCKKKRTLEELFKGVPSRDEIISLPENKRVCDECGAALEPIGKEFVRYEFRFTLAKGEVDFLDGFSDGYLETDGYKDYNNLPGIRHCSCWAYTRRYFIDAVPKGKQYDYSNPAVQGVQFCSKLFEYERRSQNKKHSFEQRKAYRLEKEKPILDAFWNLLDEQKPRKGSRFETAVKYAQNRKDTLMTYLLEHRPSEAMSDEQLEALTPWSEEVKNVYKN